jgi:ABC-type dipeptide/oligopeptide/nickel transport system permease component
MSGIYKKIILSIIRVLSVPAIVTVLVWFAFKTIGGEMMSAYQGPGILGWLGNVYGNFDFGMAGDWNISDQPLAPFLFHALKNTGAIVFLAIFIASLLSLAWTYLTWNYPYNRFINTGSMIFRFLSSWPILIGAIFIAVLVRGQSLSMLAMPAIILAICDNNLNDFRDNLDYEIKNVLKSDYAISAIGQGRSYFKNLLPELSWKIISFIASRLPAIVSGIIILEYFFNTGGIYDSLSTFHKARDLNAILGMTFLVSFFLTLWSSIFNLLHLIIDPRQR